MKSAKSKRPIIGVVVAIACGSVMLFLAIVALTRPLRADWAKDFTKRGDQYLAEKKYISAIVEYRKAEALLPGHETSDRIALANDSQTDVSKLENYYRENNNIVQMDLLNKSKSVPETSYDLVALSKNLLEKNEPQLAAKAAETATEMDKDYRDAWLYLGISNFLIAKQVEMSSGNSNQYLAQAKESLEHARLLDPSYEPTIQYLSQL